jgi:MFS transporter, DHA1 family, multidrug resistance protein
MVTKNRLFKYDEEVEGWECPHAYTNPDELEKKLEEANAQNEAAALEEPSAEPVYPDPETRLEEVESHPVEQIESEEQEKKEKIEDSEGNLPAELDMIPTHKHGEHADDMSSQSSHLEGIRTARTAQSQLSRVGTRGALQKSVTRADLEQQFTLATLEPGPSRPVIPEKLDDGTILVDWYMTDDPENPQNWSLTKKMVVSTQIYLYTLAVYMGSAIFAPSEPGIMVAFGVSQQVAALGLSMYVLPTHNPPPSFCLQLTFSFQVRSRVRNRSNALESHK